MYLSSNNAWGGKRFYSYKFIGTGSKNETSTIPGWVKDPNVGTRNQPTKKVKEKAPTPHSHKSLNKVISRNHTGGWYQKEKNKKAPPYVVHWFSCSQVTACSYEQTAMLRVCWSLRLAPAISWLRLQRSAASLKKKNKIIINAHFLFQVKKKCICFFFFLKVNLSFK